MTTAAELQRAVLNGPDSLFVMRRVVEQALTLIPSAEGSVIELATADVFTDVCASGILQHSIGTPVPRNGSLSGLALVTGETLVCDDSAIDDRVDREACQRGGVVSLICAPLQRGTEVVGVLKLGSSRAHAFDSESAALLASLATFISDAIAGWADLARSATAGRTTNQLSSNAVFNADLKTHIRLDETPAAARVSHFVSTVLRPSIVDDGDATRRVQAVLAGTGLSMQFQPIVDLDTRHLVGYEALARFTGPPVRPPDVWFAEAQRVGLGAELQLAAIQQALEQLPHLPPQAYLAVNVGHDIAGSIELLRLLHEVDSSRVVIELTEHQQVEDYPALISAVRSLRATGARLAIDDAGVGFAGFSNIRKLAPDLVKLDRILTTGIDADPARQALAAALVNFAAATGAKVIAEGIETAGELDVIRQLGIDYGQGYFLGRPGPGTHMTDSPEVAPSYAVPDRYAERPTQCQPQPEDQGGIAVETEQRSGSPSVGEVQQIPSPSELSSDSPRVSWLQLTAWARLFSALRSLRQADSSIPAPVGEQRMETREAAEAIHPDFFTIEALADEIGVPVETLERWRKAGYGPAAIVSDDNNETRFVRLAVDQWRVGHLSTALLDVVGSPSLPDQSWNAPRDVQVSRVAMRMNTPT
jgi:EAL domain-containing protein (putative c-di-GMP-specific phosphodiesterase class I)